MIEKTKASTRHWDRVYVRMPVEIVVESDGARISYPASTVDFSSQGARVQSKVALVPGEQISFIWHGAIPQSLQGRVVWAAPAAPAQPREAGVQFLQPLETAA